MPRVTVTLGSNRPGGLDITLAGLCAQTFQDFEVVFTDGRYHKRHAEVLDAVKRSGLRQPFYHVPNHRYSDSIWGTACAGYNTGFALASGDLVVMLLDYGYAPPDWLECHVKHEGKLTIAPHLYRTLTGAITNDGAPAIEFDRTSIDALGYDEAIRQVQASRDRYDEISCFAEPFHAEQLEVFPPEHLSIPEDGEHQPYFFSTKNESFPLANILAINGMDERYDLGRGPGDPDLGYRLSFSGLSPWIAREAVVHCINPRRILPNMNIVVPEHGELPQQYGVRWSVATGNAYYEMRKGTGQGWVRNPISLAELRESLWCWREMSQERGAIIPRNVVSDAEHFRLRPVEAA